MEMARCHQNQLSLRLEILSIERIAMLDFKQGGELFPSSHPPSDICPKHSLGGGVSACAEGGEERALV